MCSSPNNRVSPRNVSVYGRHSGCRPANLLAKGWQLVFHSGFFLRGWNNCLHTTTMTTPLTSVHAKMMVRFRKHCFLPLPARFYGVLNGILFDVRTLELNYPAFASLKTSSQDESRRQTLCCAFLAAAKQIAETLPNPE